MPKTLLTALAAAAMLASAMPMNRAVAVAVATRPAPAVANARLVHEAAIVCGGNGCNTVQTKAQKRRKIKPLGYTKPI